MGEFLERLVITNFQSLGSVDLELDRFSVLVGPSSSGKSAVLRAIKAVARNVQSPAAVSHGQSSFRVEAHFSDCVVTVERGKAKSNYELDGEVYPKSGTSVPGDVISRLRMPTAAGLELSLAGQFDRPFLLAETGSAAAKVLGELTNASLLMEAAREANRRRQEHERLAKLRAKDVEAVKARMAEYQGLAEEKALLIEARTLVDEARDLNSVLVRLAHSIETAELAEKVAQAARDQASNVPDAQAELLEAERLSRERLMLGNLVSAIEQSAAVRLGARNDAKAQAELVSQIRAQEIVLLREMGTCPVCGQATGSI